MLENSGSDHVTQIASRVCVALALTVSQTVQFAALGIAEVIVRRASPAGLMGCTAGIRSGGGASPLSAV